METQTTRVLKLLRSNKVQGVPNYKFARAGMLRYGAYIKDLRDDGYNILTQRDKLPNGRASNVWRYFLLEDEVRKYIKHKSDAGELLEESIKSKWLTSKIGKLGA